MLVLFHLFNGVVEGVVNGFVVVRGDLLAATDAVREKISLATHRKKI